MVIPDKIKKLMIAGFVSAIAAFQFYISIAPLTGRPLAGWYWPFIDYPMYRGTIREGDRIPVRTIVIARTSTGEEIEITADTVGLGIYRFENLVHTLTGSVKNHADIIDLLVRNLDSREDIIEIQLLNYPLVITRSGAKEVPSELLKRIQL